MPARFASTMIVASTATQPPIHPTYGPNALVVQVNEVPQSGRAVELPVRVRGEEHREEPGDEDGRHLQPATATTRPMVAVSAYAGATLEMPSVTLPSIPTEPLERPLSWTSVGFTVPPALGRVRPACEESLAAGPDDRLPVWQA